MPARRLRPAGPRRDPAADRGAARSAWSRSTRATPSPFAASLLFSYVANFIYDGDAPLAERRAQALSVDQAQLRELLGEAELRELLDAEAIESLERSLQRLEGRRVRHADGVHDLLLSLGDLTEEEIRARCEPGGDVRGVARRALARATGDRCADRRRAARGRGRGRGRLRDALGVVPPPGLPAAFLEPVEDPLSDLLSRYARTHGPFRLEDAAGRLGLAVGIVRLALDRLAERGRVLEGDFLPGGSSREWCDAEVLRAIKRRSLAKLRREVEPVEPAAFARFLAEWQGVARPRAGLEALLSAVEQLQGAPIPASALETEVLPARIDRFGPADLDFLLSSGEIVWRGLEPLGPADGRVALYLADRAALLAPRPSETEGELAARIRALLRERGALFFPDLAAETGAFAGDLVEALWDLVWAGEVTNDTLAPLRSLLRGSSAKSARRVRGSAFRSRRLGPPGSEGRWALVPRSARKPPSETERRAALVRALLDRHGVVTREAVAAEGIVGGFASVYPVFKAMEEAGQVRRGYFVAGLGATQFALPGAEDRLRGQREAPEPDAAQTLVLAATDPANPYGAALAWPQAGAEMPGRNGPPARRSF